jgi:ornithine cyclodeaminase
VGRKDDDRSIVEEAQIIVTATRSLLPIFAGRRVQAGAFVCAVGSSQPDSRELDDELFRRTDAVIVESKLQTLAEAGDLKLLPSEVRHHLNVVELGDVLSHKVRARRTDHDIVVFKSVGVGLADIVVAGVAYRRLTSRRPDCAS